VCLRFKYSSTPRLDSLAEYLATTARFDETAFQWEHIDKAAQRFKLSLRPVLQGVEFAASAADDPLIEAVQFVKEASRSGKALGACKEQDIPLQWVPEKMKRYLYEKDASKWQSGTDEFFFEGHLVLCRLLCVIAWAS
jgi:hypothetical protein